MEFYKKSSNFVPEMNKIVKDSAKLLSANVVAQAVALVVYPILSRLYSPDDFGMLNLFMSIGGILVLLSTAEYQYAIVLPKDDKKANAVLGVGLMVLACVTGLVVLSLPFSRHIASLFKAPDLARWWWMMPCYVLAIGGWTLLNYYYTRKGSFSRIGAYQVSQSVLNSGAKIGLGYAGFLSGGLVVSSVFAPLLALCGSLFGAWRKQIISLRIRYSCATLKQAAKEYDKFPKFSLPRALVNVLGGALPALALEPVFGLKVLGFWGMAMALAYRPINMVISSLYQPLFVRATSLVQQKQPLMPFAKRLLLLEVVALVPFLIAVWFATPWLVHVILGHGWTEVASYVRWMLPWLGLLIVSNLLAYLPDIFFKQKVSAILEICCFLLRLMAVIIGIAMQNFEIAIWGYIAAAVVVCLVQIVWYMMLAWKYDKTLA